MKCPRCNESAGTRVVDSREGADGRSVRRRRECELCAFRFTTFERLEDTLPMVVKKGGGREAFDRYKILGGMKRACEKRPVSVESMEEAVKEIELTLIERGAGEVTSNEIGEFVTQKLRQLDLVAYIRFASVYREFADIGEFVKVLQELDSDLGRLEQQRV